MLIAILSDIHSNLEAFLAVVDNMEKRDPDMVVCLGDLIGYGPDPEETVQLVLEKGYHCVLGNHEAALIEPKMRNWLNFQAKENSRETEQLMSHETLSYCRGLKNNMIIEGGEFVHGFPPDSVLTYLTMVTEDDISSYFFTSATNITFVGHTHDLLIASWDGKKVVRKKLPLGKYSLQPDKRYIINAGSVGQPRDGDNCAKYLLWDTVAHFIEVIYVPYDFKTTAQKIEDRGFPKAYGYRLR